jgi:hypothetical protein
VEIPGIPLPAGKKVRAPNIGVSNPLRKRSAVQVVAKRGALFVFIYIQWELPTVVDCYLHPAAAAAVYM